MHCDLSGLGLLLGLAACTGVIGAGGGGSGAADGGKIGDPSYPDAGLAGDGDGGSLPEEVCITPPTGAQPDGCDANAVWDGSDCIPVRYECGVAVVGENEPIDSRSRLDAIGRSFTLRNLPGFPESLLNPDSQADAIAIQQRRIDAMEEEDGKLVRTWEFVMNETSAAYMNDHPDELGADAVGFMRHQARVASFIWSQSSPDIHRKARLTRIVIVSDSVLNNNAGGWVVRNEPDRGYWANDEMNGVAGPIPADIDSRWAMTDDYGQWIAGYQSQKIDNIIADVGLVHELTHHLPVGDTYVNNAGRGHGIRVPQPGGKTAVFDWNRIGFMDNDHMAGPSNLALSGPSSHAILEFWERNPMQVRTMQWGDAFGPVVHIYGNFFYSSVTIRVTGLDSAGITGCDYALEPPSIEGVPPEDEIAVASSSKRQSVTFSGGTCEVVLTAAQQCDAWPGAYVLLERGDFTLPLYLGRNVIESLYWSADSPGSSSTLTLEATSELDARMDIMADELASGATTVMMQHSLAYLAPLPWEEPSDDNAVFVGPLDDLGSRYAMEVR